MSTIIGVPGRGIAICNQLEFLRFYVLLYKSLNLSISTIIL